MSDERTYRPGEEVYCKGKECKDKRCEICPSSRTTQMETAKDSFRGNREKFPIGYYSGNGIAKIKKIDENGNVVTTYAYTRWSGD